MIDGFWHGVGMGLGLVFITSGAWLMCWLWAWVYSWLTDSANDYLHKQHSDEWYEPDPTDQWKV